MRFLIAFVFAGCLFAQSDVTGSVTKNRVTQIQGQPITNPPGSAIGQVLTWNGSTWVGVAPTASPISTVFGRTGAVVAAANDYSFSQISGTATAAQIPSLTGDVTGLVNATVVAKINGIGVSGTPTTYQFLQYNGTNWAPVTGVQSVFGRAGQVIAAANDYSFDKISGAVPNSQIAAGLDAVKIGAGTVSNTAFGYLSAVTSDIQAQLNAKLGSSGAATAVILATGTRPTCNVSARGQFWPTFGATGVTDVLEYCAKDATDTYAWHGVMGQ